MSERSTEPDQNAPVLIEVSDDKFALVGDNGDGTEDDAKAKEPFSRRTVALASLLVAGLAGAAVLGTFGWQVARENDATLAAPDQVAGLKRDDGEAAREAAESLRTALSAEADLDTTLGAVFADPATQNHSVLFSGGTTLIWTPASDLDTVFGLFSDKAGAVTGLKEVPAGRLGGIMKCGDTTSPDGTIAVCGWADHGSLGLAMFPGRTTAESAPLMLQLRDGIQTRN